MSDSKTEESWVLTEWASELLKSLMYLYKSSSSDHSESMAATHINHVDTSNPHPHTEQCKTCREKQTFLLKDSSIISPQHCGGGGGGVLNKSNFFIAHKCQNYQTYEFLQTINCVLYRQGACSPGFTCFSAPTPLI